MRNTWTSVDAAHRLRLREKAPPGYFAAFPLGRAMDGIATVGEVVDVARRRIRGRRHGASRGRVARLRASIEAGRPELGGIGTLTRVDTDAAAPEAYLGALGGSGLTAYVGLFDVAGLREGDVVWVSAAAGSVGSLVAQMAKIRGHRVIGSAGSDDKVRLPARRARPRRRVQLPGGSGRRSCYARRRPTASTSTSTTSAATTSRRRSERCGVAAASPCAARSPSTTRRDPAPGPRNLFLAVANDLTLRGFRGSSHVDRTDEMTREIGAWLRDGRIRCRRDRSSTGSSTPRRPSPVSCAAIRPARRWCGSPSGRRGGAPAGLRAPARRAKSLRSITSPKGDRLAAPRGGALAVVEAVRQLLDHVPRRPEPAEADAEGAVSCRARRSPPR